MARVPDILAEKVSDASQREGELSRTDVLRAVDELVDQCRVESLWYVRRDYYPRTDEERRQILEAIQERSTLDTFRRAGVLKAWLSRHCSDESASC